jgi:hypothetical protein
MGWLGGWLLALIDTWGFGAGVWGWGFAALLETWNGMDGCGRNIACDCDGSSSRGRFWGWIKCVWYFFGVLLYLIEDILYRSYEHWQFRFRH